MRRHPAEPAVVVERRPERGHQHEPEGHPAGRPEHPGPVAENQEQDRPDLRHHLGLAERGRGNGDAARVGHAAEHGDGELPPEDDGDHPGRRHAHLHQGHERGGDQQLVRQRVHELAELRHLPAAPGQVAVQPVRERRGTEDGRAQDLLGHADDDLGLARQQHHDEQRNEEDTGQRKRVRQVHRDALPLDPDLIVTPAARGPACAGGRPGRGRL